MKKLVSAYTKKNGKTSAGTPRFRPDPNKYLFNIDTLWLNVDVYHYDQILQHRLLDLLIQGRTFLADENQALSVDVRLDGYEQPLKFDIMGGQQPLYQYSIRNKDYAIYFAKKQRENQSPIKIQINQFKLWEKGVKGAFHEADQLLRSFTFMPYNYKLNRIDFACHSDQFHWNLSDIKGLTYPLNFSKDNTPNVFRMDLHNDTFQTLTHGSRDRLYFRLYNKSIEIEKNKKYYFYDLYKNVDMDTENVWNIEFECRRSFLKELKQENEEYKPYVDDFEYCLSNNGLSKIWTILLQKYCHNSAHWTQIMRSDHNDFHFVNDNDISILKDNESSFDREVAQIYGRLQMGVINDENYDLEHAIQKFREKANELEKRKEITFKEQVLLKKSKYVNKNINKTIKKDLRANADQ